MGEKGPEVESEPVAEVPTSSTELPPDRGWVAMESLRGDGAPPEAHRDEGKGTVEQSGS